MREYSVMIASRIEYVLGEMEMKYRYLDSGVFEMGVTTDSAISAIRVLIIAEKDGFHVRAISPVNVNVFDKKKMYELMTFFTRVNFLLKRGCFIMDLNDGEICYKYNVDCEDLEIISESIVRNAILHPVVLFRQYLFGIEAILFNSEGADEAFERCEDYAQRKICELLKSIEETTS